MTRISDITRVLYRAIAFTSLTFVKPLWNTGKDLLHNAPVYNTTGKKDDVTEKWLRGDLLHHAAQETESGQDRRNKPSTCTFWFIAS